VNPSQVGFGELAGLWEEGRRRLAATAPPERVVLERVIDEIVVELRRRLGGPFTVNELAALYVGGIDWCFQIAASVAPTTPEAWDLTTVGGAAFLRYAREAVDYPLGRRMAGES
jgi:hypothetical protein